MSFLYPRTITIKRPGGMPTNLIGWQGEAPSAEPGKETVIAEGIQANIQAKGAGGSGPVGLPGDGKTNIWRVLTPKGALGDGQVQNRDVIYDDLQRRFQVTADYTNSLGANFIVERMEA